MAHMTTVLGSLFLHTNQPPHKDMQPLTKQVALAVEQFCQQGSRFLQIKIILRCIVFEGISMW